MRKDIKQLVNYYVKKFNTRNPYKLAECLNVEVQIGELGSQAGCYMFLKNHKCIFLNEDLEENEMRLVMAHELGHAIMHRKENCYFIRNKTLMLTSKLEIEANTFAAELLIPDEIIFENRQTTTEQLSRLLGYEQALRASIKNFLKNRRIFVMPLLVIIILLILAWFLYKLIYYRSNSFIELKNKIEKYTKDCNDLNDHIYELKRTHIGIDQLDYGKASYQDASNYNYKRPELKKQVFAPNICNCSRSVCDSARKQPFKYVCKYFNIKSTEENLEQFENMLNNFEAAENGKNLLVNEKNNIINGISSEIPFLIKTFDKKNLEKKLGFEPIDLSTIYFPKYIFKYTSSGGNAATQCDVVFNLDNLNRFVVYLSELVKFKKSAAGQRALMTSKLRKSILERDGYTCQKCGASQKNEPNLLLEVDHIVPISKGGITSVENLQTLCWRCNRSKGSKLDF